MPLWLALLLIAVAAVLICEVIAALKPPHPTLDLADRETRALRGVWRCRLLAGLAVIISWAQHGAYHPGSPGWVADAVSGFFVVGAVVLVLVSWRLARGFLR